jgi:hypothetical protein
MPGGEVVTLGPAGGDAADDTHYYRYSASGEELGSAPGPYWWRLYFEEFGKLEQRHADSYWSEYQGYVTRYKSDTGKPLETYDYTGKRITGQAPTRAPGCFEWLSGDSLQQLHAQQRGERHFEGAGQGA